MGLKCRLMKFVRKRTQSKILQRPDLQYLVFVFTFETVFSCLQVKFVTHSSSNCGDLLIFLTRDYFNPKEALLIDFGQS